MRSRGGVRRRRRRRPLAEHVSQPLNGFHSNSVFWHLQEIPPDLFFIFAILPILKPHCIRCNHFKVDDVSALEASSKLPVRIVEDNVTASLH
jgi:hypothetical protein